MFKMKILFCIGLFLTLVSCEQQKTPHDEFLAALQKEVDAGIPYEKIVLKIMLKQFPDQEDPQSTIIEKYDFFISDEELALEEQKKQQFIEDIKNRNCDDVWSYLDENRPQFKDSNYNLLGFFLEKGICLERDPAKAAEIYSSFIMENYNNYIGAARLGNLYWKGDGVEKNTTLAEYYFKKAAIWQANSIWVEKHGEFFLDPKDTPEFKIWGLTPNQLSLNFTNIEIGPWKLPEPLTKKVQWIESLAVEGGSEIFEIAQHLFHGTGGYEQDKDTAGYWMSGAGEFFNNHEAEYLSLLWDLDRYQCNLEDRPKTLLDCDHWLSSVLGSMERAAGAGNNKAILFMINSYTENPDGEWSDWALYQFLLLAQKEELGVDESLLEKARKGLSPLEQKVIETWVIDDFKMPIKNYLPLETPALEDMQ